MEVDDLVDRNQSHRGSERCADPAQRPARLAGVQLRQHRCEIGRGSIKALLEPLDHLFDAIGRHRLQHIIDRPLLERGDRVLVVGRDEYDMAGPCKRFGDFDTGLHRHADVEEGDIRLELARKRQRLLAILGFGHDSELRPGLRESSAELRAQHRLVFGDKRGALLNAHKEVRRSRVLRAGRFLGA